MSSIACGFAAEGYLNFGWLGVVVVGLLGGVVFGYYEYRFIFAWLQLGRDGCGPLATSLALLTIESQLVQYIGGIAQIVVAALIVFRNHQGRELTLGLVSSDFRRLLQICCRSR